MPRYDFDDPVYAQQILMLFSLHTSLAIPVPSFIRCGEPISQEYMELVVDDIHKGTVYFQSTVVFDEPQFTELVHEKADA